MAVCLKMVNERMGRTRSILVVCVLAMIASTAPVESKLADRSRVVKARQESGRIGQYLDNGRPLEGPSYRSQRRDAERDTEERIQGEKNKPVTATKPTWKLEEETRPSGDVIMLQANQEETPEEFQRKLSSQLSGCCYNHQAYSAANLCASYGHDCESGSTKSHDSGDSQCTHEGLSFIGISFSVNTASGNPYSYQLCDQFPMENIIDRNYDYVMSMDEDGWLVGGGYKTFDYSGKMPYVLFCDSMLHLPRQHN